MNSTNCKTLGIHNIFLINDQQEKQIASESDENLRIFSRNCEHVYLNNFEGETIIGSLNDKY